MPWPHGGLAVVWLVLLVAWQPGGLVEPAAQRGVWVGRVGLMGRLAGKGWAAGVEGRVTGSPVGRVVGPGGRRSGRGDG